VAFSRPSKRPGPLMEQVIWLVAFQAGWPPTSTIDTGRTATVSRPRSEWLRLAQVIEARPDELAEDEVVVCHGLPGCEVVAGFAAVEHPVWIGLMVFGIATFGYSVSFDITPPARAAVTGRERSSRRTTAASRVIVIALRWCVVRCRANSVAPMV
jgi:hypothetical protein